MRECGPEIGGRRPDCIIEVRRALPNRLMELSRDEAGLALYECRIVLPDIEKVLLVRFVERKHVHQHDRAGFDCDLTLNRKRGSKGRNSDMMAPLELDVPCRYGIMMSYYIDMIVSIMFYGDI